MRHVRLLLVSLFVFYPVVASASSISLSFAGSFRLGTSGQQIPITGLFVMDAAAPDLDSSPTSGSYLAVGPQYGISVFTPTETLNFFGQLSVTISITGSFSPGAILSIRAPGASLMFLQHACQHSFSPCSDTLAGALGQGSYGFNHIFTGGYQGQIAGPYPLSFITIPVVAPEPGTWLLVGTGVAALVRRLTSPRRRLRD